MLYDRVVLHSPMTVNECRARLEEAFDTSLFGFGKQPFIGQVSAEKIAVHKRIKGRNSFQTEYVGKLSQMPATEGTVIRGRMRLFPFTAIFMPFLFLWLGWYALTMSLPTAFIYLFGDVSTLRPQWVGDIIGPPFMIMSGIAVFAVGRYSARTEEDDILAFLHTTINANESNDGEIGSR